MAKAKEILMTEEEIQKLKSELDILKTVKRKEAAEQVGIARSFGDLSENSEYEEAKNEQAKIESKIHEYEEILKHAKIIKREETDKISVGDTVKFLYVESNKEVVFTIGSSINADPTKKIISDQSPIGRAIIGTKVNDVVEVEIPKGVTKIKILEIEKYRG